VHAFVKEKGDPCGEWYSSRRICHIAKHELRHKEKYEADLPLNFTKHNLYYQYCYGRGWLPKADNKGRYPKFELFTKHNKDDVIWEGDMDT
jgi:hypothetical protein